MKTKELTINAYISLGINQVTDKITVTVSESATKEEIEQAKEEAAREWMFDQIDWGWGEVK